MAVITLDDPDGIIIAPGDLSLEIRPGVKVGTNNAATLGVRTITGASVLNYGSVLAGGRWE